MEAVLGEFLAAIHAQCFAFGIDPRRWHENPVIASAWEVLAAKRLADRIQEGRKVGEDRALHAAAGTLGLNGETLRSRWRRAV